MDDHGGSEKQFEKHNTENLNKSSFHDKGSMGDIDRNFERQSSDIVHNYQHLSMVKGDENHDKNFLKNSNII